MADQPDDPTSTSAEPADAASGPQQARPDVTFKQLGLRNQLLRRLRETGYEQPTPIQREAIPHLMEGRDLLGQAATGTGKTAAFVLPILDAIGRTPPTMPRALVVAPTRELAQQVAAATRGYGAHLGTTVVTVVGGQPLHRQVKDLEAGAHVVVATPGRAVDLLGRDALSLDLVDTVVLDEADEMMDMGFEEDLDAILAATPDSRQTVMFSATVPDRILHLARRHLDDPVRVTIERPTTASGAPLVTQSVAWVHRTHKPTALARFLEVERPDAAIVFCRTRVEVDDLAATMLARGHAAEALHGGMDQRQRDRVMRRLRDGSATLLLATDVAARGLDVDTLTHVFNYDVPSQAEAYVHRIGRVGRAGRRGVAITLAEPRDRRNVKLIQRLLGRDLEVVDVPSVEAMRARQVRLTTDDLEDALDDGPVDGAQEVLAAMLADGHEPHDVVLAAISLVHDARRSDEDEQRIPDALEDRGQHGRREQTSRKGRGGSGRPDHADQVERGWLFVDLGRVEGIRPGDLVGAIANEGGLRGSEIGPIRIAQHHSKVGIPHDRVEHVLAVMRETTVRGKKATVRRWMD